MIKTETVLILGAGASCSYGFPLGSKLKSRIFEILDEQKYKELLQDCSHHFNADVIAKFRYDLRSARDSIDAFLEHKTDKVEIDLGKAAIATVLLEYEQDFQLWVKWLTDGMERSKDDKNWYGLLVDFLIEEVPFEYFDRNKLSIITFNYDRSLEQFLYQTLKSSYPGQSDKEYIEKVKQIPILHLYGSLGPLPWQSSEGCVKYDGAISNSKIITASSNIEIIHHATDESDNIIQAQKLLTKARRIFFLGFGYHPTNMRRLGIDRLKYKYRDSVLIRGTIKDLRIDRHRRLSAMKIPAGNPALQLIDATIYDLFYSRFDLQS